MDFSINHEYNIHYNRASVGLRALPGDRLPHLLVVPFDVGVERRSLFCTLEKYGPKQQGTPSGG